MQDTERCPKCDRYTGPGGRMCGECMEIPLVDYPQNVRSAARMLELGAQALYASIRAGEDEGEVNRLYCECLDTAADFAEAFNKYTLPDLDDEA